MREEVHGFFSDRLRLEGKFFLPDEVPSDGQLPLVVPCSGFTGLMDLHPARFARALTRAGLVCFGFDYRGFGESEGERGRVILEEQVRDIQHAVAYAATDERVDPDRIFLLGWGMGAGLVLAAGRHLPGVRGLVCLNGFYSGRRLYESEHDPPEMEELYREIRDDRRRRAVTGEVRWADPFGFYLLDPVSAAYVNEVLRPNPAYRAERYSFELADSLLNWEPDVYAPTYRIPLLIGHGTENHLHTVEEAWRLFVTYGGLRELHWLEDAGHTEWMRDDNETFQALCRKLVSWIEQRLRERPRPEETAAYTIASPQQRDRAVITSSRGDDDAVRG
jgi:uncharacterized protein